MTNAQIKKDNITLWYTDIAKKSRKITSHFTEIAEISILLLNYILAMNKCTYSITKLVLTKYM